MATLRRWMAITGGFYVLIGLFNTPFVIEARLPFQFPELGVEVDSVAARALIDTWFMFGLEMLVVGAALIRFSRTPSRHLGLVWTVIALELVRGVADDLYWIARGHDPIVYAGWIAIHLVIVATGIHAVGRARRAETLAQA